MTPSTLLANVQEKKRGSLSRSLVTIPGHVITKTLTRALSGLIGLRTTPGYRFPHRTSADQNIQAIPRSLSQPGTSFITILALLFSSPQTRVAGRMNDYFQVGLFQPAWLLSQACLGHAFPQPYRSLEISLRTSSFLFFEDVFTPSMKCTNP